MGKHTVNDKGVVLLRGCLHQTGFAVRRVLNLIPTFTQAFNDIFRYARIIFYQRPKLVKYIYLFTLSMGARTLFSNSYSSDMGD